MADKYFVSYEHLISTLHILIFITKERSFALESGTSEILFQATITRATRLTIFHTLVSHNWLERNPQQRIASLHFIMLNKYYLNYFNEVVNIIPIDIPSDCLCELQPNRRTGAYVVTKSETWLQVAVNGWWVNLHTTSSNILRLVWVWRGEPYNHALSPTHIERTCCCEIKF